MSNVQKSPQAGSYQPASDDSIASRSTSIPTQAPDYEWVYPNSADGKYFTSTQGRIYIGNLFIDELASLQFAYQGNRIPIYGYSSRKADGFGTGRVLVQGQIALNFVTEGYLYTALKEFSSKMTPSVQKGADYGAQLASLVQQAGDSSGASAALMLQIQMVAEQGGPDAIAAAKNALISKPTVNAIELDIPFDIRCTLEGAGRTVERVLRNCVLISNEQIYDQSGAVLLDVYGFIARDAN